MSQTVMNRNTGWQQVAVFEVYDSEKAVVEEFARSYADDRDLRICAMPRAPQGFAWYEGMVDFAGGERRAIYQASSLVQALECAAFPGYRLVSGSEWMTLATAQAALEKCAGPAR